jgi:hypothetical protein
VYRTKKGISGLKITSGSSLVEENSQMDPKEKAGSQRDKKLLPRSAGRSSTCKGKERGAPNLQS